MEGEHKLRKQVQKNKIKVREKNNVLLNWFILVIWLALAIGYIHLGTSLLETIGKSASRNVVSTYEQFLMIGSEIAMLCLGILLIYPAFTFMHLWYTNKLNPITLLLGDLK